MTMVIKVGRKYAAYDESVIVEVTMLLDKVVYYNVIKSPYEGNPESLNYPMVNFKQETKPYYKIVKDTALARKMYTNKDYEVEDGFLVMEIDYVKTN